jgi:hypothetical protein
MTFTGRSCDAAISLRKLGWRSELATTRGARSAAIVNRPSSIVYDPVHSNVFWESGIYNKNGIYRSDDGGTTFSALG